MLRQFISTKCAVFFGHFPCPRFGLVSLYVVHEARTQDGRPHTHTYVILPAMARDDGEGWQPFKNYCSRGHLALLDEIATMN